MMTTAKQLSAFVFAIPYAAVAGAAGAAATEEIPLPKSISNVTINVLLPLKAGIVGVMAAALLAFWGFFWAEIIAPETSLEELPAIVRSYRRSFAYIVPSILLLFTSIGADFYLYLVNQHSRTSASISFGCFAASLFMLGAFILDFATRTIIQMDALRKAGETSGPARPGSASHTAGA
jgi:hypothetical protein